MDLFFFSEDFRKTPKKPKSHENPSIGRQVVPCGRADMTVLTDAFRNFAERA
jgi:hypothetical protein